MKTARSGSAAGSVEQPIVLLAGNPNTGKTSLFNALSGLRAKTANYAGVTVDIRKATVPLTVDCAQGTAQLSMQLIDLPGLYGLVPTSPEETIASEALCDQRLGDPAAVVIVVDSTNMTRGLTLVHSILELQLPAVVALNLIDAADSSGIRIDVAKLSEKLGCPVVAVSSKTGRGLDDLKTLLSDLLSPETVITPAYETSCAVGCSGCAYAERFARSESMVADTVSGPALSPAYTEKLDRFLTAPWVGTIALVLIMLSVFLMIFSLADIPMSLIEGAFAWIAGKLDGILPTERVSPWIWYPAVAASTAVVFAAAYRLASVRWTWQTGLAAAIATVLIALLPQADFRSLLLNGVVGGIAGVVVFLPQICILFFLITILEDSGYMARAAFVAERWMRRVGLPGKAFVPMLSAHACAIPGIMATRTIENWRDRLVTIAVLPLLTCSARLPVYAMLAALLFGGQPVYAALMFAGAYVLGITSALLTALVLRRTVIKGETEPLVIELPPYRRPSLRNAFLTTWDRGSVFLRKAGSVILLIAVVLWAMATYPKPPQDADSTVLASNVSEALSEAEIAAAEHAQAQLEMEYSIAGRAGKLIEPIFRPLGFDWKINIGVISSFAAREVLVSTLSVVYGIGEEGAEDETGLVETLRRQRRPDGTLVFTTATCFSLLVFFVLAMQCLPTQAVTRRETGSWRWAIFQLVYMSALAYVAALIVFQTLSAFGFHHTA
ncbi:ferrous iron transporter B [Stieleria varia]|uniref:ferrous iron transporter B n=1 Tax=Stieleria varia TaxID=2528005 RepID=UPI0018D26A56|nr:ferrous iron transporter B [Stieleria varia]